MKAILAVNGAGLPEGKLGMERGEYFRRIERLYSAKLEEKNVIPKDTDTVEISLTFMEREGIAEINWKYRETEGATDILSFPMWEEDAAFQPPDGWGSLPLGDLVVCAEAVADNAEENKKSFVEELTLVLSHGLLHLIGYDHDTEEREREMWLEQDSMTAEFFRKAGAGNE